MYMYKNGECKLHTVYEIIEWYTTRQIDKRQRKYHTNNGTTVIRRLEDMICAANTPTQLSL